MYGFDPNGEIELPYVPQTIVDYQFINDDIFDFNLPDEVKKQRTLEKFGRLYRSGYTRIEIFFTDLYIFHTQKGTFSIWVEPAILEEFAETENLDIVKTETDLKLSYKKV